VPTEVAHCADEDKRVTDPDVTLTDFGLALLCAILAWRAWLDADSTLRAWLAGFLAAAGAASLFGGTVHGFFSAEDSLGHEVFWPLTMLSLGLAAVAGWGLGAQIAIVARFRPWIVGLAALSFLVFTAVVLAGHQRFDLAIAYYLPAALFVLLALVVAQFARSSVARWVAIAGLLLTFVAAAIQQLEVPLHPRYFDHNALYHVVQATALILFFLGMREEHPEGRDDIAPRGALRASDLEQTS